MAAEQRIVDNRVFLLGLDEMYRTRMKRHEREELLIAARAVAKALGVSPADVPIEGYYSEEPALTEYFRLFRALQREPCEAEAKLRNVPEFARLKALTESGLYGRPATKAVLLPAGVDALTLALNRVYPDWTAKTLVEAAYTCAMESDDFGLVTLAALAKDAVVLAALRESCVLYAMAAEAMPMGEEPKYVWKVDEPLRRRADRFIETFNRLFDESLPRAAADNAARFWGASQDANVIGRCVRLGFDDATQPVRQYHWAIRYDRRKGPIVEEIWDTTIWTTQRYRAKLESA